MSKWSSWRVRCRRVWSPSPTPISPCWGRLAGLAAFCAVCRRSLRADDGRSPTCVRSKALRNGCTRSYLVLLNFLFLVSCSFDFCHRILGVARIWCKEGHETNLRVTQKYYQKMHAVNKNEAILFLGRQPQRVKCQSFCDSVSKK